MDPKTILRSFWQLINVVVIVGLQALSLFMISYAAALIAMGTGVRGCPARPEYFEWYGLSKIIVLSLIGLCAFILSVHYIFNPSVWMQKIDKHLAFGPTHISLPFFSTHPLYVALDFLFLIPAIALFQGGRAETMCLLNREWVMGWTILLLACFYPIFRAVCWFVLNRKIEAMTIKTPWLPIIWWYIFAFPLFVFLTYTYMDKQFLPKLRVPVVNEITFKGGLDAHPEFLGKIVRVQGVLVREVAKCGLFGKDPEVTPYPFGTVLLDMGKRNGEIMVQAKKPNLVENLDVESQNKKDRIFEAFGRLSKLPDPKKRMVCGIGKADSKQKGGLALLEIEEP